MVFLKEFFKKVIFEKINRRQKSMKIFPGGKELRIHAPIKGTLNIFGSELGDICILICHLGRYIIGFTVTNSAFGHLLGKS